MTHLRAVRSGRRGGKALPRGHKVQGGEGADSGGGVAWHGGLFCSTADSNSGLSAPSCLSFQGTSPTSWGDRPKLDPQWAAPRLGVSVVEPEQPGPRAREARAVRPTVGGPRSRV